MAFDVGAIVARLDLDITKWKQSIGTVTKDKSLEGFILKHKDGIGTLGKSMTVAGGAVIASFGAMVKAAADYGDTMNDISQRTGVGVDVLSGLKLAADKSGTSVDGLAIGIKGLSVNMVEANSGSKEASALFKALGVSVADANGNLKPSGDLLFEIADRFAAMEDGTAKTTLAVKLFGKSGMELIPMLNMGAKGLEENRAEAERLGLVLDKKAAAAADNFNDQLESLKGAVMGMAVQIGQTLMPAIQSIVGTVTNVIAAFRSWAAEHPTLSGLITKLAAGVGLLMAAIGPLLVALPTLIKLKTGLKAILPGLEQGIKNIKPAQLAANAAWVVAIGLVVDYAGKLRELKAAEEEAADAARRQWDTEDRLIEKLSEAGVVANMSAKMRELIASHYGEYDALAKEIREEKHGIELKEALAKVSEKSAAAYDKLKSSMKSATGAADEKNTALTEQISIEQTGIGSARSFGDIIGQAADKMDELAYSTDSALPPARNLIGVMEQAPGAFDESQESVYSFGEAISETMSEVSTIVTNAVQNIAAAIVDVFNIHGALTYQAKEFDNSLYENLKEKAQEAYEAAKEALQSQLETVRETYSQQKEIINEQYNRQLDAARTYFARLEREAKQVYDRMRRELDNYYDNVREQAERAFDNQELGYKRAAEIEDLRYDRQFEDQERKYERQYERERRAIENSTMSEEEKQKALRALDIKYENEKIKRERAYENEKLRRERQRENARIKREREHQRHLEAIAREKAQRERQLELELQKKLAEMARHREERERELARRKEARERAAERRAEQRQRDLIAALLALDKKHEADVDNIRAAEDAARDKHAQDEERRQNSLWNKVKGIFATTVTEMAKAWLGNLIQKIIPSFGDVGEAAKKAGGVIKSTLGNNLSGVANIAKNMAGGFLSSLGSVGSIITGITSLISLLKGPQKSTDVTYWLKMIQEQTKEARDWLFINAAFWLETIVGRIDLTRDSLVTLVADTVTYLSKINVQLQAIFDMTKTKLTAIMENTERGGSGGGGGGGGGTTTFRRSQNNTVVTTSTGPGVNVNITFNVTSVDSVDTERFIRDKARPSIERTIQRALRARTITVPSYAIGGS